MSYKCFLFLYSYPKVTSIQTTTFCKFRYDNIQLVYSGLKNVGQGLGGPSLRSAELPRFPRKRSWGCRGRAWSVGQVALNGHNPFTTCESRLVMDMWCYSCTIYVKWTPFYNLRNYVVLPWCKCPWERTRDCVTIPLLSKFFN
jgi:hypothetical protein